jgi:PKD repeat protein
MSGPHAVQAIKGCSVSQTIPGQICVHNASCDVDPPPSSLWGALRPVGVVNAGTDYAIVNNSTNYDGNRLADSRYVAWTSVDIENGWLFASWWGGLEIWDVGSPGAATAPVLQSRVDGWHSAFPNWQAGTTNEIDQIVYLAEAPDGDDTFVTVGGLEWLGFAIIDTTSKTAPVVRYQDHSGKWISGLYAARIGSHTYAFAGDGGTDFGLYVYDLTEARSRNYVGCGENRSAGLNTCPGVYIREITGDGSQYVHGLAAGERQFVVRSAGVGNPKSVAIYDVTTPASPVLVARGYGAGAAGCPPNGCFTAGVAMWATGASQYLGVRRGATLDIIDVTDCLDANGCGQALPAPIKTVTTPAVPESDNWKSLVFSRSGTTPILFLGNHDLCAEGEGAASKEMVLDVTSAAAPVDLTPPTVVSYNFPQPLDNGQFVPPVTLSVGYWSWFYSTYAKGWAFSASRGAKFNGRYLYRASLAIGDIHEWIPAPVAAFDWSPTTIYPGTVVTFSDTSSGDEDSRAWTFPGGSPLTATTAMPAVTFAAPGSKLVQLTATNGGGTSGVSHPIPVIDPNVAITAAATDLAGPTLCQTTTFTASATGQPTIGYAWQILRDTGGGLLPVGGANGSGSPFAWTVPADIAFVGGSYVGRVTASNSSNSVSQDVPFSVLGLPAEITPAATETSPGAWQFHLAHPAALAWSWDFDDDANDTTEDWTPWVSDPQLGPDPTHAYITTGLRSVKVRIRTCLDPPTDFLPTVSVPILVDVTQVYPPVFSDDMESGALAGWDALEPVP